MTAEKDTQQEQPTTINITLTQQHKPTGFWEAYNVARSVSWMVLLVLAIGWIVSVAR